MLNVHVDTSKALAGIRTAKVGIKNWTPALAEWGRGTGKSIRDEWSTKTYARMYLVGDIFRGVAYWKGVPPMYTRKDGTMVPPWGGVVTANREKINAKRFANKKQPLKRGGMVKGRKRPSGKRVKPESIVGQDTGKMMRELTTRYLVFNNYRAVKLYTVVKYARAQNDLRALVAMGPKDTERLTVAVQRQWRNASAGLR